MEIATELELDKDAERNVMSELQRAWSITVDIVNA
jgi:hypothetical protein